MLDENKINISDDLYYAKIDDYEKMFSYMAIGLKKFDIVSNPSENEATFPLGFCNALVKKMYVSIDGNYFVCEKINEHNSENIIGNIYSGINFEKLLKIQNTISDLAIEKCSKCWAIRFCTICHTSLNEALENEKRCDLVRDECEEHFKKYIQIMNSNSEKLREIFSKIHILY